jgi:hypothetical protein
MRYGTHYDTDQPWWLAEEAPEVEYDRSIEDPLDRSPTWHSYVVLPQPASRTDPRAHPYYERSINHAAERAFDSKGACFTVWWDGDSVYVRASEAAGPKNGKLVCIAQHWADDTVQLRFTGARSEWRHVRSHEEVVQS